MLKVLIVDDHEIIRRGIKQILLEEFSFVEINEAYDTASLVEKAISESWDIIISDLSMPGGGGLQALSLIREKRPHQRILIISIYPEEQYAIKAISLGASGFLNKDIAIDNLVVAIQTILSGRRYIHPSLAERMTTSMCKKAGLLPHEVLSERELTVMVKLASGFPVSKISRQLSLTANSVSTYRSRILEKMDMQSNADIRKYVIEKKLI